MEIWSWSFPPMRELRRGGMRGGSPTSALHPSRGRRRHIALRGDPLPGRGVAPRSGSVLMATAWHVPSPSFLDELARERRGSEGCPSRLGLPQPGHIPERLLLVSPNNPDLLWWLLGVLPHLPGSWCVAVTREHLGRACPLQPLPTLFLLLLALFQAHSSSPAWESSCCPEPTATILYKVILPLSAENNTKVTPSYQRFQKKPNTSLARFRFNLIISLKRGFVLFVSFVFWKKKVLFLPFLLRPLSEGQ